jgi:hypothetical protein
MNEVTQNANGLPVDDRSWMYCKVWVNVIIIDAFNRIPQAALWKSSKFFKLYDEQNCMDVMEKCLMFKVDDDIHLMAQFPLGLYHSTLKDESEDENKVKKDLNSSMISKNSLA